MKFTRYEKRAIADLLDSLELKMNEKGRYKGQHGTHSAATIEGLIKDGYADINIRSSEGRILAVIPTEKTVNLIPVWA